MFSIRLPKAVFESMAVGRHSGRIATVARTPRSTLPPIIPVLALGAFLMCTTEFLIAGLLSQMAADFGVRPSQIGLLITAFAVGMIVGAPVMALATLRLPKRATLVLALTTFAVGHIIAALSGSFELLFAARVLTGVATGAFWSAATIVATRAAGPNDRTRALGVIGSGVALATVLGVPLGSLAGEQLGWRGAFWALAVLAVLAAAVIGRYTPGEGTRTAMSVRSELRALRSVRLWLVLGGTVLIMGGCMGTFSFISPLLTERSGIPLGLVPLVFVCFGVGSMIGTNGIGRFADRRPVAALIGCALAAGLVLMLLIPLSANPVTAVVVITLLGAVSMAIPTAATGLSVRLAHSAPTLAAAFTVSAFNGGVAAGSSLGGHSLNTSLGQTGPATLGVVMVALGLVPLAAVAKRRASRSKTRIDNDRLQSCGAQPAPA
jgi:predicted MFS family arabinose efflux permease